MANVANVRFLEGPLIGVSVEVDSVRTPSVVNWSDETVERWIPDSQVGVGLIIHTIVVILTVMQYFVW